MKKIISISLSVFFIIHIAYSQTLKPNSVARANKLAFSVRAAGTDNLSVVNINNAYFGKKPKLPQSALSHFDKSESNSLLNSFNQTFSNARIRQLLPENGLLINYYVNTTGKVLGVSFLINKNTLLTPTELEKLEESIKKNVDFKLHPEETKGGDFFIITQVAKYSKVLDKTLK